VLHVHGRVLVVAGAAPADEAAAAAHGAATAGPAAGKG
jgi:hypothetical protein